MANSAADTIKIVAQVIIAVVVPIMLSAIGWLFLETLSHGDDLTGIKASRFTSKDAALMRADISTQLAGIQASIHNLDTKIPQRERMEVLEQSLQKLQIDVVTIAQTVKTIEKQQGMKDQ